MNRTLASITLCLLGVGIALLTSEVILRQLRPATVFVWPPGLRIVSRPAPEVMPGISGSSIFTINSIGVRGEELSYTKDFRILAVGGSTTESLFLDDSEAWPYLTQEKLRRDGHENAWVGNVGVSGKRARHNLLQLEEISANIPNLKIALFLLGVNDFLIRLSRGEEIEPETENQEYINQLYKESFDWSSVFPKPSEKWFERTALWRRIQDLVSPRPPIEEKYLKQDRSGDIYVEWRKKRASASKFVTSLPDLAVALSRYRRTLERIIQKSRELNITPVLISQPTLWRDGLSAQETSLLWTGGIGNFQSELGHEYYAVETLQLGMQKYNDILLEVCKIEKITCLDLAATMPKTMEYFYDDCHYNEAGARYVADVVATSLKDLVP